MINELRAFILALQGVMSWFDATEGPIKSTLRKLIIIIYQASW